MDMNDPRYIEWERTADRAIGCIIIAWLCIIGFCMAFSWAVFEDLKEHHKRNDKERAAQKAVR